MKAIRLLAMCALLVACAFSASRPAPSPPAPEADIDLAPGPDPSTEVPPETPARVEPDEARAWRVPSPVTGRVVRILAQVGQRVKKGDALATIQSLDIVHTTSDLQRAEAEWIAAEHDFKRQKTLCEIDCVRRDFEAAEDAYRRARAKHDRARAMAIHRSHGDFDPWPSQSYTLPSPVDGEVMSRDVFPGEIVEGHSGDGAFKALFVIGTRDEVP